MRSGKADALIILGQPSKAYLRMICEQTLPVVFLDFYDERSGISCVVGDNAYGCYRLTAHLIRNGHRDIGFVGNPMVTSSIMDRYLGYYRAMMMNNLPVRPEWVIPDRDETGRLSEIVLPEELPTALVCNCDLVARQVVQLLRSRGLRVPEDISVTGFDDFLPVAGDPSLTTFRVDVASMVQMTVKLVADSCAGVGGVGRVVIGGHPVYRSSDAVLEN